MMQFYTKRDFGAFISDTFNFFKIYGKNYIKNYFLLNGIFLLLMLVVIGVGFGQFFTQLFGSNVSGQSYYFEQYFQENEALLIITVIAVMIVAMAISVIAYSFPVFYMKLASETGRTNFKSDELLAELKKNSGKIFKLFLGLTFIISPIFLILFAVSYLMILILIGFFLLLLLVPTSFNIIYFLMFDYLSRPDRGFFESLSYAFRSQFSYKNPNEKTPFWKYWGATCVIFIIYYVLSTIISIVPMLFVWFSAFTVPQGGSEADVLNSTTAVLVLAIYMVSIFVSYILMNMIAVNSGLMYYDSRTDVHQQLDMLEIDRIGQNEV